MNGLFIAGIVAGFIIIFILFYIITTYNKLVKLRNKVKDQWSQVDIELKRRFDLIPNLVEVVKGYAKHEEKTFEEVAKARSLGLSAASPRYEMEANSELTAAIGSLFAIAEAYPELRANENFKELQKSLADTEEKIAFSRQFYNDIVMQYQTATHTFPAKIVAKMFGFNSEDYILASDEERKNVEVKL